MRNAINLRHQITALIIAAFVSLWHSLRGGNITIFDTPHDLKLDSHAFKPILLTGHFQDIAPSLNRTLEAKKRTPQELPIQQLFNHGAKSWLRMPIFIQNELSFN